MIDMSDEITFFSDGYHIFCEWPTKQNFSFWGRLVVKIQQEIDKKQRELIFVILGQYNATLNMAVILRPISRCHITQLSHSIFQIEDINNTEQLILPFHPDYSFSSLTSLIYHWKLSDGKGKEGFPLNSWKHRDLYKTK